LNLLSGRRFMILVVLRIHDVLLWHIVIAVIRKIYEFCLFILQDFHILSPLFK
jgi:hypothetical protein